MISTTEFKECHQLLETSLLKVIGTNSYELNERNLIPIITQLLYKKNLDIHQLIDTTKNVLPLMDENTINNLLKSIVERDRTLVKSTTSNFQQNIFIFWHLFGFARNLIRSFIISNNDELLSIRNNDNERISIFSYLMNYDIFEVRANYFMEILNQMNFFDDLELEFIYDEIFLCCKNINN
uniref:Transcriptional regulator n=1 Tax=Meloidogyne hapla TaxID=6305 RepID=A0A1I8BLZ3_MELHA